MVQLRVWTKVGVTEDVDKVMVSLRNFFPEVEFKVNGNRVEGKREGRTAIDELRQKIWAKHVLDTAREMMLRRIDGNVTTLMIHKQAAYAGKLGLVNRDDESPLGAIHIELQSGKLEELIDWLAPETIKGKPVEGFKSNQD